MKDKILNNWSLKLLSIVIASAIWLIVVNYDNPYTTKTITGIPIDIVNEETLTDNDMIYTVVSAQTASVRVRCPRKTAESLKASDFKAEADFNDMYDLTDQVPITITCTNTKVTSDEITQLTQSLQIEIETMDKRTMEVKVDITGEPSEGYKVGESVCSPSSVVVSAPTSFLDQISYVGVQVDVDGISKSISRKCDLKFYNAAGNPMDVSDQTNLEVNVDEVDVEVEILNVKSVNIDYTVTGQDDVAAGYLYSGVELSANSVEISGRKSDLASVSALTIPSGELDVSDADRNIVRTFDLRDLLPEGTSLVDEDNYTLTVTLKIEKKNTKEYTVNVSQMDITGLGEDLYISNTDAEAEVTVQGLSSDLDALNVSEIEVKIDLEGMEAGTHSVPLEITLPRGFTLVGTSRILIHLSEQVKETASDSAAESSVNSSESAGESAGESVPESVSESDAADDSSSAESESAESSSAESTNNEEDESGQ